MADFILVSNARLDEESEKRREVFLKNLQDEEGLVLEHLEIDGLLFVKVTTPMNILKMGADFLRLRFPFKDLEPGKERPDDDSKHLTAIFSLEKEYLFNDDLQFTPQDRTRIVSFLLNKTRFSNDIDDVSAYCVKKLVADGVFSEAFVLHDGSSCLEGSQRRFLDIEWASLKKICKKQPLNSIRDYFGVKIALYFTWLGFYTFMLIPPSIVGFICFIYGVITLSDDIVIKEICNGVMTNITMCPVCDNLCPSTNLGDSCLIFQLKHFFDNESTVFFALFMSIWAIITVEFWKRYVAEVTHRWDVFGYDPEDEHPRQDYLAEIEKINVEEKEYNFFTDSLEAKVPFWKIVFPRKAFSWSIVMVLMWLPVIAVVGIIMYNMAMVTAMGSLEEGDIKDNSGLIISVTGAVINLVLILTFNIIYDKLALWLTKRELLRTQVEFDESLTLKIYLFEFVNNYFSIFYVAFLKGRFVGTPDSFNRIFGLRLEECSPGGCFIELWIQLAVIFMGVQFASALPEYIIPMAKMFWKRYTNKIKQDDSGVCSNLPQFLQDFSLEDFGERGLFYEYLEMFLQFGFIFIFGCVFPLAPLFALINNVLELRFDAKKILLYHRRPVAQNVKSLGIWLKIMESIGWISIITNCAIIAFTSEFIPKLVYMTNYSPDNSLTGFTNFSLSFHEVGGGKYCRYPGYHLPPWDERKYEHSQAYVWITLYRLAFMVTFLIVVSSVVKILKWIIPDVPKSLKQKIKREKCLEDKLKELRWKESRYSVD